MKITLFVPHQDDELGLFGPLFVKYIKTGFEIEVVFVTNGDYNQLEKVRYYESLEVSKTLGISKVWYFGFPDSGFCKGETIYSSIIKPYKSLRGYTCTYKPVIDSNDNYYVTKNPSSPYTKQAMLETFISFLKMDRPDIIVSTSWDNHPDHRIVSSVLSEALLFFCKNNTDYHPLYLEGFVYLGSWLGVDDYLSSAPKETLPFIDGKDISSFPFLWSDRIRVFVDPKEFRPFFWKTKTYKAYSKYVSQNALGHFFSSINTDKCFWLRSTNNLALNASVICSSGDSSPINDFKLLETSDMRTQSFAANNQKLIHWSPSIEDKKRFIQIKFNNKVQFDTIVIHQGYGKEQLGCTIVINNQSFYYELNSFCQNIEFPSLVETDLIEIAFDPIDNSTIAIREIEVFNRTTKNDVLSSFLSISNLLPYKRIPALLYYPLKIVRLFLLYIDSAKRKKQQQLS